MPDFGPGMLQDMLRTQDTKPDKSRVGAGVIHASSLMDFCPRREIMATKNPPKQRPSSADRLMWATGRAFEHHIRQQIIAHVGPHNVFGEWTCKCGHTKFEGVGGQRKCPKCGGMTDVYGEVDLIDRDLRIVGHCDMFLVRGTTLVAVEVKSINKRGFEALKGPKADHAVQVSRYVKMARRMGYDTQDECIVIYALKEYVFHGRVYKEYIVDASEYAGIIDASWDDVREMREHEIDGTLPNRLPACGGPSSPKAKQCPMCVRCFMEPNGEDDADSD